MNDKEFKRSMCRMHNRQENDYACSHGGYNPRFIDVPGDDVSRHAPSKHQYVDMDTEADDCGNIVALDHEISGDSPP